jgi:ABC-2 type transport system permease protein
MVNALLIAHKEFTDMITSKRLWLIVGLFLLLSVASTYATSFGFRIAGLRVARPMLTIASNLSSTMSYMAPILGVALAFDAISGERERGTLRILLSRPIFREDVINGKIISALVVIGLTITASSLVSISVSILLHNVTVSVDDISRICLFIVFSIVFSFAYYALSLFISTLFSRSSYSLISGIGIWIFFAFILPIASSLVATVLLGPPPTIPLFNRTQGGQFGNMSLPESYVSYYRKVSEISSAIQTVSINHHYSQIVNPLFGAAISIGPAGSRVERTLDVPTIISSHAIDLIVLIIFPIIFLVASYMVFTRRQEK